jgi:hypothetical protein
MRKEIRMKLWHLIFAIIAGMFAVLTAFFMVLSASGGKSTKISENIVIVIISSITSVSVAIIAAKYKESKKDEEKPDLGEPNYDDFLGDIMANIRDRFNVYRCAYWAYSNGTYTADGYGLQNCSMMVERNRDRVRDVIMDMQLIPKTVFQRNLLPLRDQAYHITYEDQHDDSLGHLNQGLGVKTAIFFKVRNSGKWTGVLGLGFDISKHQISEDDIAYVSLQVSRIEAIIKQIKNKK